MAESEMTLKLLIDTKNQRVLFAEAGKNAVDFLFHILALPVGTVIRLLSKQEMVGCMANLYESIENLDETYIQQNQTKEILLKPKAPHTGNFSSPLFALPYEKRKTHYTCNNNKCHYCNGYKCGLYFTDDSGAICPTCRQTMCAQINYVAPPAVQPQAGGVVASEGGFVKGVVTYMIMDDLVVKPMSTISSITLLNKFKVKEVETLEEKVVNLGMNEALNLLKASLASKTVLTRVFLKNTSA